VGRQHRQRGLLAPLVPAAGDRPSPSLFFRSTSISMPDPVSRSTYSFSHKEPPPSLNLSPIHVILSRRALALPNCSEIPSQTAPVISLKCLVGRLETSSLRAERPDRCCCCCAVPQAMSCLNLAAATARSPACLVPASTPCCYRPLCISSTAPLPPSPKPRTAVPVLPSSWLTRAAPARQRPARSSSRLHGRLPSSSRIRPAATDPLPLLRPSLRPESPPPLDRPLDVSSCQARPGNLTTTLETGDVGER